MAVGTTNFPASLDDSVSLPIPENNASSTLAAGINTTDLTITITDPGEFPDAGEFTIVDDLDNPTQIENVKIESRSGSDFSVEAGGRGAGGTTAQSWSGGAFIECRPNKLYYTALRSAIVAIEAKLGTGSLIDAAQLADGSVSSAELQYLNGVTSAIQTQLDAKQAAFSNQSANVVYAGPASGGAAAPGFRSLVAADIPDLSATYSVVGHNHSGVYEPANANIQSHVASTSNPHSVTKSQVGLGNVENTALSTWAGSSNITTLGTVTTGTLSTGAVIGGVTMTLGSDGTGDIYYRSAGGVLTRLAAGTNGHVLTLSSGLPAWQAASGGGLTVGTTAIASGTAGRILYEASGNVLGEIAGSSVTAGGTTIFGLDTSGATNSFYIGGQTDAGNNGFRFFGLSPHLYTDLKSGTGGFWYIRMDNSSGSTPRLTLDNTGQFGVNISASIGAQLHAVSGSASRVGLRIDSAATPSAPVLRLTNNGTTGYEFWGSYWQVQKEASTDPTTSELTAGDHFAIYRKNDKFVIAYNNAATMTYLTIPLDGSTTTWTNSTTAP